MNPEKQNRILAFASVFFASLALFPRAAACADFEPGLVTKVLENHIAVNVGEEQGIAVGDTLLIFRSTDSGKEYIALVRIIAVKGKSSGAEIIVLRNGKNIEVLDRVGSRPESLSMFEDRRTDNLSFLQQYNMQLQSDAAKLSPADSKDSKKNKMVPELVLFTVGGIGVGVTAASAAFAIYHDYKSKYEDDPLASADHLSKYQNYRNVRNVAVISTAAILTMGVISHYLLKD